MVRLIGPDGEDLCISVGRECDVASAVGMARRKIGLVGAIQDKDGNRVLLDWGTRMDAMPVAQRALGDARTTRHERSTVARILGVTLDMGVAHVTGGKSLVLFPVQPEPHHVVVQHPLHPELTFVGMAGTVDDLRRATECVWGCIVWVIACGGRVLDDNAPLASLKSRAVLHAFDLPSSASCFELRWNFTALECTIVRQAGGDQWYSDLAECTFACHTPCMTAELLQPLCWSPTGMVWRKAEALAAARVMARFGVRHALPLVLAHLALSPEEWLRGLPVSGRVQRSEVVDYSSGDLDEVKFRFLPDAPLALGGRVRLTVDAHPCGTPHATWFVQLA